MDAIIPAAIRRDAVLQALASPPLGAVLDHGGEPCGRAAGLKQRYANSPSYPAARFTTLPHASRSREIVRWPRPAVWLRLALSSSQPAHMPLLVLGLVLFLGIHSVRIFADDWRSAQIVQRGAKLWKLGYTVLSIAGFALIVVGYVEARAATTTLWVPPVWTRHVAILLVLIAFVLLAAANVPGTKLKAAVHHPMVLGIKTWAFAHLIANGSVADVVLFGSFLVWAIVDYASLRRRDRRDGIVYPAGAWSRDAIAVVAGVAAGLIFALWLHRPLIGVNPMT